MIVDSIRQHYNRNPYPDPDYILNNNPLTKYDLTIPDDVDYTGKNICIAGTGTVQALLVANKCPDANIVALDISENALSMSELICQRFGIQNVKHVYQNFECFEGEGFDLVLATGVIHHTKNKTAFVNTAHNILNDSGIFTGMVYCKEGRGGVRELSDHFIQNEYTVDQVKSYLRTNAISFSKIHGWDDSEIADVWLNPRFHEYTENEFDIEFLNSKWNMSVRKFRKNNNKTKLYFRCTK